MDTSFRCRLKKGDYLLGTLITLSSPEVVDLLADCGFDWFFYDLEHSAMGVQEVQTLLQVAGNRCAGVIRVPLNDEIWFKKVLDIGADGVIVPLVNSAEEARQAVRFSKFPPIGRRSVGIARAHGYGSRFLEYVSTANDKIAVLVQAEHYLAVENIDEIVKVDGVDGVIIGPFDLSASLGKAGQVSDAEVRASIQKIRAACEKVGLPVGIFGATLESAEGLRSEGYHLLAAATDTMLLGRAGRELVERLRR